MTGKPLVTGMVRSGTSLISRSLDAHPEVVCALDPCLGFFRSVRNELLHRHYGGCPDPEAPFGDLFFGGTPSLEVFTRANYDLPLEFETLEVIRERLAYFNRDSNSPLLVPALARLGGEKSYRELMESLLGLLQEIYGSGACRQVGFVQTWVEVFTPLWLNTWPEAFCLHIIRDPRAVIASWLKTVDLTHDYPLLMMLRHWRKSAALASLFSRRFQENFQVWRYEDFVSQPETLLRDFCRRLGLEFSPAMLETFNFRSGAGQTWESNTSYERPEGISAGYVDKWRERLSRQDLQFLEDFCSLEMGRWHYDRVTPPGAPLSLLRVPELSRQVQGEADWVRQHDGEYVPQPLNYAKELYRWYVAHHPEAAQSRSSQELADLFIDPGLLEDS